MGGLLSKLVDDDTPEHRQSIKDYKSKHPKPYSWHRDAMLYGTKEQIPLLKDTTH